MVRLGPEGEALFGLPDVERIPIALVVALRGGRVLVARRPPDAEHLPGAWEFPGGKIEPGEEPAAAARRELLEETGLRAGALDPLTVAVFDYPDRLLRFHVFVAPNPDGEVDAGDRDWSWVAPGEFDGVPMPPANAQVLRALRWRLRG